MFTNLGLETFARYLADRWFARRGIKRRGPSRTGLRLGVESLETRQLLTTYTVTTALDNTTADSVLSLREALLAANTNAGADTITFDSSLSGQKISLNLSQLEITDPVTITGLGALNTVIDAETHSRVFNISSTAGNVTLEGLTVTGGRTDVDNASGAGIRYLASGTLTLNDVAVTTNATTGSNSQGAGIGTTTGSVILIDSTVSGNSTGGLNSPGGGIATGSGAITLINSTVSSNATGANNSGGGGISTFNGNIKLVNSTVAFNLTSGTSSPGGGIFSNGPGGSFPTNVITINNSIVAKNTSSSSTSADLSKAAGTSSLIVNSSLIGVNTGSGLTAAPLGSPDANGNLIGTNAVAIDPKLGSLALNGGTTKTHVLLITSPAIDAGNNSLALDLTNTALSFDQAGQIRVFHNTVDMGAFELQQAASVPSVTFNLASQTAGEGAGVFSLTVNLSAAATQNITLPFALSGTATNGTDYTITTSPLIITAGATSATIQVTITDDALVEGNETVIVTLGTPTNATLGATTTETLTITDNDNGAPTNITLSSSVVAENAANVTVGTLTATDPNVGDTAAFTIQAGGQGNLFVVSGNVLKVGATGLNFEALTGGVATVTVRATDSTGLFLDKQFNITVTDVNETPSITSGQVFSVTEASATNTVVGTVVATDLDTTAPNSTLTYSILSGNTNNAFTINSSTGEITVATPSALNAATKPTFTLSVKVVDGGSPQLSATQNVTVNVTDANSAPSITAGQVFTTAENRVVGSVVGTVAASDPDSTAPNKTLTYSILSGNTNNAFAINSSTGQITINTSSAVNFEVTPQFVLSIQVADGGNPSLTASANVTINVADANDAPTVPAGQTFTVGQNAPVNTVVGTVTANDVDASAPNNTLSYSIVSGNTNVAFAINSSTGVITVNNSSALNPAVVPQFVLQVRVADGGTPSLSTTQSVTINVSAVNQAPTIPAGQAFSISENSSANSTVGTVSANDPDSSAPNNTLTYSITGGNSNNAFAISATTGQLTVNNAAALNFEVTPQFVLQIQVADGGNPSLTATQNVTVNITDVNEAPVMNAGQSFFVNEHTANSVAVGTVQATDPDSVAPNKTLTYSILSGNTSNAFAINSSTGQITVANSSALSFAVAPSFSLQIKVADGGNPSLSSTQAVTVTLIDVNESPSINAGQTFVIADNSAANAVVGTVIASDPDSTAPNKTLTYSISSGNSGNAFAINSATGQITVLTPSALNSTTTPQYSLLIQVTDGGSPALSVSQNVTINVTAPNRAPTIPAGQSFSISENSPTSTPVGVVSASDPDTVAPNNTLNYSIASGNTNSAFGINTATGQITVANAAALNFETTPTFSLQIRVGDGGNPSLSTTQTVVVHVTDVNEAPALTLNQNFVVNENALNGTTVGTVLATDPDQSAPNGTLNYSIIGGNTNNAFTINSLNGNISVANSSALNVVSNPQFNLQIQVSDNGVVPLTTTGTVSIKVFDVNETPTIPAGQVFVLNENPSQNAVVGTVSASDPDATAPNKTLTYSITGGNISSAFAINPTTGQLTVANPGAVSFESNPQFVLQIDVVDGGSPQRSASQSVTININDVNEAPEVFAGQTFTIPERSTVNTVVGTVVALDPDLTAPANTLTYSIVSGNTGNAFAINPGTGQITVANSLPLESAVNPQFTLQIKVQDGGSPSQSTTQTVKVNLADVNDAPSIPNGQTFSIAENSAAGAAVGTLAAIDTDTNTANRTLTYSITGGNNLSAFVINASTGQITVNNAAALNFETTTQFVLQVQVVDGGNPSLSAANSVTINVTDANEAPSIPAGQSFALTENASAGAVVGTVAASDPDTTAPNMTLVYSIAGGNTGTAFAINSATGQITVNNAAALNFEVNPTFTLQINVTDGGGLTTSQSVSVNLTDANDAPTIVAGQVLTVTEHAAVNTVVGTVSATDPDTVAPNNTLTYAISGGNTGGAFAINASTGQITVANSAALNFAQNSTFALQVTVTDGAPVPLSATQSVTINLADVNEAPSIPAGQVLNVLENAANGAIVGTVSASDPDPAGPNSTLTYSIVGGNAGNAFAINASTGQITVINSSAINFETTAQFGLQVKVADGANPSLSATQTVTITVGDVNEGPSIAANQFLSIAEDATAGASVGFIIATDPDQSAPNNALTYSIVGGNTGNVFTINAATGQVTVADPSLLSFATTPLYTLSIQVTDGGNLSATQTVTVNVTDANEPPVLGNSGDAPVYIHQGKNSIAVLPNITVSDADSNEAIAQVIISLPIPAGKKNPDVIGITAGANALGTLTETIVNGRRQFTITLNSGVTNSAVQAFLRSITFSTKGKGLKLAQRDFQIQVIDRQGAASNVITQDVQVTKRSRR